MNLNSVQCTYYYGLGLNFPYFVGAHTHTIILVLRGLRLKDHRQFQAVWATQCVQEEPELQFEKKSNNNEPMSSKAHLLKTSSSTDATIEKG